MRIAVLGTGFMARTLAAGFVRVGHDVVIGSRSPEAAEGLPAPVTDTRSAIEGSEVVVSALAAAHSVEALTPLADALDGRILLDLGNAVNERMELLYEDSSLGERLQIALPGTRVVKTLNTVGGPIGAQPDLLPAPTVVFLSGDDDGAKATVGALLGDLGWAPDQRVDLGGIVTARATEHYFLLFAALMGALRNPAFNIAVVR